MIDKDIASSVEWLKNPGNVVILQSSDDSPIDSGKLQSYLGRRQPFPASVHFSRCNMSQGGPWAGVREIFEDLLPRLQKVPKLVERHDYELATILPSLRRTLTVRNPNLTDSAPDRERVRIYPAERATRIVHGLVDLLSAWKESHEQEPWVICCLALDQAGPLVQRFFAELMRRRGLRAGISLMATTCGSRADALRAQFQPHSILTLSALGGSPEPPEPSQMAVLARALEEKAGDDPIEREVHAPAIIYSWLGSNEPQRALEWQMEAFSIYTKQGFYQEALLYGEAVLLALETYCGSDERKVVRLINKLCSCYVTIGQPEKALSVVQYGIDRLQDPGLRGYIHYLLGMLHTRFLPERDLSRAEAHLELGLAGIDASSLEESEKHFQKAFNRNGLALVRHRQGRHAEAIELCRLAFGILREHLDAERHRLHRSVLLYNIAQVYGALGNFEEAVTHYSGAMEMDPNYSEYYNERGSLFLKQGLFEEALGDFRVAIELSPPYFQVWTNLGQCLRNMRRYREAVEAYSNALDLEPSDGLALLARAQCYDALGELEKAIADYSAVLEAGPGPWEVLANRATLYYQQGQAAEALRDLDAAIALAPGVGDLFQNRAMVLEGLGRAEQAVEDLRKCLELDPEAEDRADFEARLQRLEVFASDGGLRAGSTSAQP